MAVVPPSREPGNRRRVLRMGIAPGIGLCSIGTFEVSRVAARSTTRRCASRDSPSGLRCTTMTRASTGTLKARRDASSARTAGAFDGTRSLTPSPLCEDGAGR
jgi:hypothetical protein